MKRCLYRYGWRRDLRCKRLLGHNGRHAQRLTIDELAKTMWRKVW